MKNFHNSSCYPINTSSTAPQLCEEKFNQIVAAICEGRYSWACVLLLQAAGHNPIHYIPPRTYKRLLKLNRTSSSALPRMTQSRDRTINSPAQAGKGSLRQKPSFQANQKSSPLKNSAESSLSQPPQAELIQDLEFIKSSDSLNSSIQGGFSSLQHWVSMLSSRR